MLGHLGLNHLLMINSDSFMLRGNCVLRKVIKMFLRRFFFLVLLIFTQYLQLNFMGLHSSYTFYYRIIRRQIISWQKEKMCVSSDVFLQDWKNRKEEKSPLSHKTSKTHLTEYMSRN